MPRTTFGVSFTSEELVFQKYNSTRLQYLDTHFKNHVNMNIENMGFYTAYKDAEVRLHFLEDVILAFLRDVKQNKIQAPQYQTHYRNLVEEYKDAIRQNIETEYHAREYIFDVNQKEKIKFTKENRPNFMQAAIDNAYKIIDEGGNQQHPLEQYNSLDDAISTAEDLFESCNQVIEKIFMETVTLAQEMNDSQEQSDSQIELQTKALNQALSELYLTLPELCRTKDPSVVAKFLDKLSSSEKRKAILTPAINGEYPLHHAAKRANVEIVKFLLIPFNKHKNDLVNMSISESGFYPIHVVFSNKTSNVDEVLSIMLEYFPVNILSKKTGRSLIHVAAYCGHESGLKFLLSYIKEKEPKLLIIILNKQDCSGLTALHVAVEENHPGIVNILLENGASPNIANSNYVGKGVFTPLYSALLTNKPGLAVEFLNRGFWIATQDIDNLITDKIKYKQAHQVYKTIEAVLQMYHISIKNTFISKLETLNVKVSGQSFLAARNSDALEMKNSTNENFSNQVS